MICPKHKKKSNSLGILIGKGLRIILADSGLKVTKGTLVMIKGKRKNNLFYLYSSVVIGGLAVPSHKPGTNDTHGYDT